ncbi:GbsR/MarR family transcriptional regulator [Amycolatopsis sp. CA-230715]|uniref:GbsR/MarR family transcriptional regulator n=1 Tax=Amycolatopsis sp. CA-230715 TaxID=2745196 RepID=UPI001C014CE3|nr:MarR family transcriptional regulator [Amycolatopsis sp. CA-230715]QWF80019.1 hypothetical protein HUW46_03434 [Amycolatopsis sp. CA-230715]
MSSRPQSQRDPDTRDDEAARRFVEKFALVLTQAGMPRMPARVFSAILADDDGEMTASEVAEALQISPAAVSGATRYLMQVGMAHRERKPGERRDHYRIGDDFWYEVIGKRDPIYSGLAEALESGIDAVGRDTKAGARIEQTRDFFNYLAKEIPALIERWRDERIRDLGHP